MGSSISSSDPWRRFCRRLLAGAVLAAAAIYGFIVLIDPFDILPLSPPFDRGPVSTNARYAFPALARKPQFDSMILGTSTSRLLRPAALDPLFEAHFVNLAMNSATAYEEWRLGKVFAGAHPGAKVALIGLDIVWCGTGDVIEKYTPRAFPEWMYDDDLWRGYLEQFDLYTLEQAGIQFGELVGLRPRRYGRDGYTDFLPDDSAYDLARARGHLYPDGDRNLRPVVPAVAMSDPERLALRFPAHPWLRDLLAAMPQALKIVYFVPYHMAVQPRSGSREAIVWQECKARVAAIVAQAPRARLVDFMRASPVTREDANYWDPLHYRLAIADWLARSLRAAADGPARVEPEGYAVE
jgi:hypothetical protein